MFKKIVVIIVIISPLLCTIFFGYPVQTYKTTQEKGIVLSKRCFKVGELGQFIHCFQSGKRIAEKQLMTNIQSKLSSLFPFFDLIFFGGIIGIVIGILLKELFD